ncbi:uncharacterized protein CANTADRAFT_26638 [Suhomyces tanzawaensis NRRL Y-17324]|uniref:WD40 repeat-like protein n=1 Tax=Suhomyces tanzawaensis NRRL Y-17324 TaxID=984487 RepID=A0A1E4SGG3_9ASCO|nr:uncharacterized protein CANTADRAFT_26638 [Suhomyces tanzawaensis NRRL Y-17324]ODV78601.1 hypothetical protein CANTADRAFT_26638 [Suhomyces tanzawaensis NRRL Y-17324]
MSAFQLVAQFLHDKGYLETLAQFQKEHGKPIAFDELDESLEDIVKDRTVYKTIEQNVEDLKLSEWTEHPLAEELAEWKDGALPSAQEVAGIDELVISGASDANYLFLTTNKLTVEVVDVQTGKIKKSLSQVLGRVVVKNVVPLTDQRVIFIGMDGKFHLFHYDADVELEKVSSIQGHKRLVVDARNIRVGEKEYVVSLGWDFMLKVFEVTNQIVPVAELKLTSQGTCFDVVNYKGDTVIVLGKHESTLLEVIRLNVDAKQLVPQYKISLNDAEFTQYGFSPMAVAIDTTTMPVPLVVVGTSHEPYMRLIVVSLAEYGVAKDIARNQILKNVNSMSPQDKYSQALVVFRGSGVWVAGDDGVLRGIDLKHGKVVAEHGGHNGKIKHLQAATGGLVSCGTDKVVKVWRY